ALGVAHVPEGRGTFVGLTVEENLRLGGFKRFRGGPANVRRKDGYFPSPARPRPPQGRAPSGGGQPMLAVAPGFGVEARACVPRRHSDWRRAWSKTSSRSSDASKRRSASASFWSSRMPILRWNWPTTLICSRPAMSSRREAPKRSPTTRRFAAPIWAIERRAMHELLQQVFSGLAAGSIYAS